jgi:branched-chain amino acid transport system ATP-binding protein
MLEVTNLHVSYGPVTAVRGVSLKAEPGKITMVLGANGAGKTTTMRAICGLQRETVGSVKLNGIEILGKSPSEIVQLGMMLVPEGRMVFAPLTVFENLRLGAYTAPAASFEDSLQHVFELFPILKERRNGAAGLLSGGEQQMLAFGRALMSGVDVILMDEPSMGLAPVVIDGVLSSARQIADSGKTILMVEQNAQGGLEIADTVVVFFRGQVSFESTASEARSNPAILQAFLGDAALATKENN